MYQITHLVYACPISITTAVFSPAARLSINDAINKNLKKEKIDVLITKQQAKLKVNMSIYRHLNIQYCRRKKTRLSTIFFVSNTKIKQINIQSPLKFK